MNPQAELWRRMLSSAAEKCGRPLQLMEVCGSHSFAIARYGLRSLLPEGVSLLSGPGCPVCVAGSCFIDAAKSLCRRGVKVALTGDLLRIPGSDGALCDEKDLLVIYSPEEALEYALTHPGEQVVFAAVGFAPTLAAAAAVLEGAAAAEVKNFTMLADFKNIRPVLDMLAADREVRLDGFLLPGHVASVTGRKWFDGAALPGVISGFAAENILHSLYLLMELIAAGKNSAAVNNYPQLVEEEGNSAAALLVGECFESCRSEWRGIGAVEDGGWKIREKYAEFDAVKRFELGGILSQTPAADRSGCRCADVLRGRIKSSECPLFGKKCTPEHPAGACMVSSEGACAAAWHYGRI